MGNFQSFTILSIAFLEYITQEISHGGVSRAGGMASDPCAQVQLSTMLPLAESATEQSICILKFGSPVRFRRNPPSHPTAIEAPRRPILECRLRRPDRTFYLPQLVCESACSAFGPLPTLRHS